MSTKRTAEEAEKHRAYMHDYYLAHKERAREKAREWRARNIEKYRELSRRKMKQYRAADPEKFKARSRANQLKHRDKYLRRRREKMLMELYGLTQGQFDAMLVAQCGRCAICDHQFLSQIAVDHDHLAGRVRELLCGKCNTALGLLDEEPRIVRAALAYLERHNGN